MNYNNAVLTITDISTPDPHVTFANQVYHLVYTAGDRVEIWSSQHLLQLGQTCKKTTIWRPPPNTPYSADVWAPELHAINGRWYIYLAAADPAHGNKSHRMYVLVGPPSHIDPTSGQYEMLGPIAGLPSSQWQIDGTVFPLNGRLYFAYSGWPLDQTDASELTQELFILELSDATTAMGRPVRICEPCEKWERSGDHGINEGPQFLSSPNGDWAGLAYSCAGSWTKEYKMNTLYYSGGDPLHPGSWHKSRRPLIQNSEGRGGPFGPGHGCFVNVGSETWAVYHATDREDQGWDGRKARVQRVLWGREGPEMGGCVGTLVKDPGLFMSGAGCAESGGGRGQGGGEGRKHGVKGMLMEAKGFLRNL
ncbi:hypothetical protein FKW77_006706 [Venturia effusa]|uniref:Glycoside hydrolase family 43 protein n=1 Tax=Venturia effusa TaxID=50376 RepID=A0A517LJ02_9PEZI|nr:hypothetical protein FKW77_006706 [Venturia effusa]